MSRSLLSRSFKSYLSTFRMREFVLFVIFLCIHIDSKCNHFPSSPPLPPSASNYHIPLDFLFSEFPYCSLLPHLPKPIFNLTTQCDPFLEEKKNLIWSLPSSKSSNNLPIKSKFLSIAKNIWPLTTSPTTLS